MQRERDKARSDRDAAAQGMATSMREREEARVERDMVHAKVREARDTTRKGWDDLMTLVEERIMAISEERGGIEYKIV